MIYLLESDREETKELKITECRASFFLYSRENCENGQIKRIAMIF